MDKIYDQILNKIPKAIDFSYITVKNETIRTFTIDNISNQSILFNIECPGTYIIEPSQGIIAKHYKAEIKVKICPDNAVVLVANAKIILDNNEKLNCITKFSSIAKYPYLTISNNILDFGNVLIGKSKEMELIITNSEKVPAKFQIKKKNILLGKHSEHFHISAYKGDIPPNASFLLKIRYNAQYPAYFTYDTFEVKTTGGNKARFSCIGNSLALSTGISCKAVNFNSIELASQMTKLLRLYNDSEEQTTYQFFYNNDGPFYIHETQGVIEAKSNIRVNITFKPKETMSYYDRVFCLIKNHFLIALDLYGSCHDLLNKSKVIEQKHIDIFRYKVVNGFYVQKSTTNSKDFDMSSYLDNINKTTRRTIVKDKYSVEIIEDGLLDSTNQVQLHKEMFWENISNTRLFYTLNNIDMIDFRFVEYGKLSEPYILTMYNNSTEKIKLKWLLEKPIITSNLTKNYNLFNNEESIFIVSPEEAVVNKKSSVEFKIYFKPQKQEFYFYSILTCMGTLLTTYDSKKEISDKAFELVRGSLPNQTLSSFGYKTNLLKTLQAQEKNFEYFDPPIPFKLPVVGHSFPPNLQIFMPMMELTPEKEVIFTPSSIYQSSYQSLTIRNHSDTPLYFKFLNDISNVFRVYPKCGLIQPKAFNLICLEFCPKEVNVYKFPLKVVFNHDTYNMHTLMLHGLCVDPFIEIEGVNDELYFPPSYIGINTKKTITLINRSPIKVNVQLSIYQCPSAVINVEPNYFDMEANQIRKLDVFLCPLTISPIEASMDLVVSRIYDPMIEMIGVFNPGSNILNKQTDKTDKRIYKKTLKILGKGSDGDLQIEPAILKFGTVKVGFHKKLSFSIYNPTICNFYVKLIIPDSDKTLDSIMNFDFKEGLINSLCKKDVSVTFKPNSRASINMKVALYAMENKNDKMTQSILSNSSSEITKSLKAEVHIEANGDYPLIKIVDIRNSNMGTSMLWQNFNADEANIELLKQLTEEEINFISSEKTNKKIQYNII